MELDPIVAPPKSKTFNCPTITGPVESAIATLRKLIRDYANNFGSNILENKQHGLDLIIKQSNYLSRVGILKGAAPIQVVQAIASGKGTPGLTKHMEEYRDARILKRNEYQSKYPIIRSKTQGYAYRLFLPTGAFAKQVDIRVSLNWYYISSYNNRMVTLIDFVSGEEKQNVYWETLVLVKGPIITGPVVIRENLLKQEKSGDSVNLHQKRLLHHTQLQMQFKI